MTDMAVPGMESEPRQREWVRIAIIFAVLAVLILIPFFRWQHKETNRPALVEIRVVSATQHEPVFREGPRIVSSGEQVSLAVALRLEYPGQGSRWVAPVERLELDGAPVDHIVAESWPDDDRLARTFWFTLEGPFLGGVLDAEDAQEKLAVRPFLAPELGHNWLADGEPESHADDDVNLGDAQIPVNAGTYRIYARVEVVAKEGSSRPLFAVTSLGTDYLDDAAMVRVSRDMEAIFPGIHPAAGHLFRLPGFEPASPSGWDPSEACAGLIATSSRTFAEMTLVGKCSGGSLGLEPLGRLMVTGSGVTSTLGWQTDIRPGDVLKQGDHWLIIVSDDGNGILDGPDLVAHSWRRPPAILPLAWALNEAPADVGAFRVTIQ